MLPVEDYKAPQNSSRCFKFWVGRYIYPLGRIASMSFLSKGWILLENLVTVFTCGYFFFLLHRFSEERHESLFPCLITGCRDNVTPQ